MSTSSRQPAAIPTTGRQSWPSKVWQLLSHTLKRTWKPTAAIVGIEVVGGGINWIILSTTPEHGVRLACYPVVRTIQIISDVVSGLFPEREARSNTVAGSSGNDMRDQRSLTSQRSTASEGGVDVAVQTACPDAQNYTDGTAEAVIGATAPGPREEPVTKKYIAPLAVLEEECRHLKQKIRDEQGRHDRGIAELKEQHAQEIRGHEKRYESIYKDLDVAMQQWIGNSRLLVMVRVRPGEEQAPQLLKLSRYTISIPSRHKPGKDPPRWTYDVDYIFDQTVENLNIFDKISPLVSVALDGKALAVIADGQSNAGKSYTMFEGHFAIAKQACWRIFEDIKVQAANGWTCQLSCSAIEEYCNELKDLSRSSETRDPPPPADVKIMGGKLVLTNVKPQPIRTVCEYYDLIRDTQARRTHSATSKNPVSSRGHFLYTLDYQRTHSTEEPVTSKICFVDLAGNERLEQNGNEKQSQETRFINKSRPELRAALEKHASFKRGGSSIKTVTLLHEFLGGDSGVVYLAHVSPLEENLSVTSQTLGYAEDLRKIGRRKPK
ncbi:MAG: hypothetical protein LQ349_001112 [Xanthoria aureola]|nr:MAG: hypothetical protein LQ349_001112 [Xanthoria aureola]